MWRIRTVLAGWTGGPGLNTFYFQEPGTISQPTDGVAVCGRVRAFWNAVGPYFPAAMTAQVQGTIDTIDPATGQITWQDSVTAPAVVTGTSGTNFLPTQCMILLKLGTSQFVNGRRVVGRSFLGPIGRLVSEAATPANVVVTAITTAGTTMKGTAPPYEQVVWHRPVYTGPVGARVLVTPGSAHAVTAVTVGTKYASLRSRRD